MSRFDYDNQPYVHRDFKISSDAMRWQPEPPDKPKKTLIYVWQELGHAPQTDDYNWGSTDDEEELFDDEDERR